MGNGIFCLMGFYFNELVTFCHQNRDRSDKEDGKLAKIVDMSPAKTPTQWQYLEARPQSWRRQFYLKSSKLRAHTVWSDMIANNLTPTEVADSKDLPLAAVYEAIAYCETHQELLEQEAEEERLYFTETRSDA